MSVTTDTSTDQIFLSTIVFASLTPSGFIPMCVHHFLLKIFLSLSFSNFWYFWAIFYFLHLAYPNVVLDQHGRKILWMFIFQVRNYFLHSKFVLAFVACQNFERAGLFMLLFEAIFDFCSTIISTLCLKLINYPSC